MTESPDKELLIQVGTREEQRKTIDVQRFGMDPSALKFTPNTTPVIKRVLFFKVLFCERQFSEFMVILAVAAFSAFRSGTYATNIDEADTVVIGRLLPQFAGNISKPFNGIPYELEELEAYFFEIVYYEKEEGKLVRATVADPFNVERVAVTRETKEAYLDKGYHLWILEEFKWTSRYNFLEATPISLEEYPSYTKAFDHWREYLIYGEEFFPEGSLSQHLDRHIVRSRWYSSELMTMGEDSIFELRDKDGLEVYRLTLLRSFDNPISVRIEVIDDNALLRTTIASGKGEATGIQSKEERYLTKGEIKQLQAFLVNKKFWEVPSFDDDQGADGSNWIIEALSEGRYHVADRCTPKGGTVRDVGELILKLAGYEPKELY